jgi:hypothetical protein
VGRSSGAPPGPDGAPDAVNFRAATPISSQYLHLRVLTLNGLTAPPAVVNGALTQGASLTDGVATYYFVATDNGRFSGWWVAWELYQGRSGVDSARNRRPPIERVRTFISSRKGI